MGVSNMWMVAGSCEERRGLMDYGLGKKCFRLAFRERPFQYYEPNSSSTLLFSSNPHDLNLTVLCLFGVEGHQLIHAFFWLFPSGELFGCLSTHENELFVFDPEFRSEEELEGYPSSKGAAYSNLSRSR